MRRMSEFWTRVGCSSESARCVLLLLSLVLNSATAHYTSTWAVHIEGGDEMADRIATKHGFRNLGKIFENHYHFEHKKVMKRSLEPETYFHNNLLDEPMVLWARQQVVKRRSKRDLIPLRPKQRVESFRFSDVRWPHMWYLNRGSGLDMNVQPAWSEGISGKGVVVTILDDGLEKTHPDLVRNYDPQASYDVNNHDEDPMPRYDVLDSNRHGTRCAGEVAAVANNSICSVGVAFGASVGGVRMLDGDVTDAVEARSLSLNPQHIDIYSASWGPDDDGKTVDGPGELATRAFIEGVTKGRQGKGSIFVWASGNGGRDHDNCNCDGYTNSIWTLSISSATEQGLVPWYSEACSSTLATTYSSGSSGERQIVTTDLHHQCTSGHTGTSASAPLAAGICALALEANRALTWRDMQHIVVRTARPINLKSNDWKVNGVGRNVSHSFGYGLMDASAMVQLARVWKTVPEQRRCEVSAPHADKQVLLELIPARSKVILNLTVTECAGVNFLEHVQAKISLSSSRRGDLQIFLTSPAGTRTTLLAKRPQDSSRSPFSSWPFMSVHTWGEVPFGIWQLEIHNEGRFLVIPIGKLEEWSLIFYGTAQMPGQPELPLRPAPEVAPYRPPSQGRKKTKQKPLYKAVQPRPAPKQPTTNLPLSVVLTARGNLSQSSKVPAPFQGYSKVEAVYPVYRKMTDILGKGGNQLIVLQKAERQDPDPPPRPKSKKKGKMAAKALQEKNNNALQRSRQGAKKSNFEGWNMILYGTETEPNAGGFTVSEHKVHTPSMLESDAEQNSAELSGNTIDGGGAKDPRHERQRTTTEATGGCGPAAAPSALCIDCQPGLFLHNSECISSCPSTYFGDSNSSLCRDCHYTCQTCSGPLDEHCLQCHSDAQPHPVPNMDTFYCYTQSLERIANNEGWYYYLFIAFLINAKILLSIIIWFCCYKCKRGKKEAQYNALSTGINLKKDLETMAYDSSDDEI